MLLDTSILRLLEKISIMIKARKETELTGNKRSKRQGVGLDFSDYRQYQPGDDYRYIDWNLYSRLQQLFLKEFIEERGLNLFFIIDKSSSMKFGNPGKFITALKLAAALGYLGLAHNDRVKGIFVNDKITKETGFIRGKRFANQYFQLLENTETGGRTDLNPSLSYFVAKYKKPGLAIILSDLFTSGDFRSGLKLLKQRRWKVMVLHILTPEEFKFEVTGNIVLTDIETKEEKDIFIDDEIKRLYQTRISSFIEDARNFCHSFGFAYHLVSTEEKLEDILLDLIMLRGGF